MGLRKCRRCGFDVIDEADRYCPLCLNRPKRYRVTSPESGRFDCYAPDKDDPAWKAENGDLDRPKVEKGKR